MAEANGTFEITSGNEDTYHQAEGGARLTRANGTQRFGGDIEGDGSVEWLMCYLPQGLTSFVGLQRIDGAIGGRTGSFVMQAVGFHDGNRSRGSWSVVAGTGTGDLVGIRGDGSFRAPGGPLATYDMEYWLS